MGLESWNMSRSLIVAIVLALAGAALAEQRVTARPLRFEVTPLWGYSALNARVIRERFGFESFEERFEHGLQIGARFGVRLGERFAVEAEYRYGPNGKRFLTLVDDPFPFGGELEVPIDAGAHAAMGGFRIDLTKSERWRPFVAAGLGAEHFRVGGGETDLRAGFGGGVRFLLRDGIAFRVDARYVLWPSFYLTEEVQSAVEADVGITLGF
jgi:hypothetical protein